MTTVAVATAENPTTVMGSPGDQLVGRQRAADRAEQVTSHQSMAAQGPVTDISKMGGVTRVGSDMGGPLRVGWWR